MQIWRWSVKCVVQLKLVGKTKQKNHGHRHGHVILLFSIKYPSNFGLKTNLTTFCAQIKAQILTQKKKLILNPHIFVLYNFTKQYGSYNSYNFTSKQYDSYILYTI